MTNDKKESKRTPLPPDKVAGMQELLHMLSDLSTEAQVLAIVYKKIDDKEYACLSNLQKIAERYKADVFPIICRNKSGDEELVCYGQLHKFPKIVNKLKELGVKENTGAIVYADVDTFLQPKITKKDS